MYYTVIIVSGKDKIEKRIILILIELLNLIKGIYLYLSIYLQKKVNGNASTQLKTHQMHMSKLSLLNYVLSKFH